MNAFQAAAHAARAAMFTACLACLTLAHAGSTDTSEAAALHVLNRLAYGPAPGDLARVQQMGIDRYISEQLQPETIRLPAPLTAQLNGLDTLGLSQRVLIHQFRDASKADKDESREGEASERRILAQRVAMQAAQARLIRAVQSPRQLEEVMVDFWFNHFNVYQGKGLDRVLVGNYEREAIRPHALGRFRDLLGATAHHPAMLFYLDNWLSVAEAQGRPVAWKAHAKTAAKPSGLNENYARELMELHTLGVDGGYTQKDVTELARMFTGWTINPRPGRGAGTEQAFYFDPRRHDVGDKDWLGHHVGARLGEQGQTEGEWALDLLASHPATARHIAFKLAQYFVADEPPAALVDQLSKRYLDSQGDIREVLKALFDSKAFRDPAQYNAKFKTPYQYVVSAMRAGDLPMLNPKPLLGALSQLGMPLYGCQTPDGYKNTEQAWLNPDALTRRIQFATTLASGKLPLMRPLAALSEGMGEGMNEGLSNNTAQGNTAAWRAPPLSASALLNTLGQGISAKTRANVTQAEPALQAAMVLGSPDFMRH